MHELLLENHRALTNAMSLSLESMRLGDEGINHITLGRARYNVTLLNQGTELLKRATALSDAAKAQWENSTRLANQITVLNNQLAASIRAGSPVYPTRSSVTSFGSAVVPPASPEEEPSSLSLPTLLDELHHLIGLSAVKADVTGIVNQLRVQELRSAHGISSPAMRWHLVFTGNPGTGKTTVARLLARIYRALGLLSKGHLVETDQPALLPAISGKRHSR